MFFKKMNQKIESIKNKMKSFFSREEHQITSEKSTITVTRVVTVMEEKPAEIKIWKQGPQRLSTVKEELLEKSIKDDDDKEKESNPEIIDSCENSGCGNCDQCKQKELLFGTSQKAKLYATIFAVTLAASNPATTAIVLGSCLAVHIGK